MRLGRHLLWLILFVGGVATSPSGAGRRDGDEPSQSRTVRHADLLEQASASLAQIHVTVSGPRESVSNLGAEDFRLKVHSTWLADFAAPVPGRSPSAYCKIDPASTRSASILMDFPVINRCAYGSIRHATM